MVMRLFKYIVLFLFAFWFILRHTDNPLENIRDFIFNRDFKLKLKNKLLVSLHKRSVHEMLVLYEILYKKVYTPAGLEIKGNDLVIDIGGSIGDFALFAASQTKGKVFVFEPSPENLRLLSVNVKQNNKKNIVINNAIVSSKTGRRKINVSINPGSYLTSTKYLGRIEIRSFTLNEIIENISNKTIGFVKIDCEGDEGEIIKSTTIKNLKRIQKLAIEYHDNVSILSHNEIIARLKKAGFIIISKGNYKYPYGYIFAKQGGL